jgi:hypothetical protein
VVVPMMAVVMMVVVGWWCRQSALRLQQAAGT